MRKILSFIISLMIFCSILPFFSNIAMAIEYPIIQNQGQSHSIIQPGDSIDLYAQARDDIALSYAYLATNETGEWQSYVHSGDWWNFDWEYYKQIQISGPIENYQMLITVYLENGYDNIENNIIDCEGNCNPDFSDLRFVNSDQTNLLSFWIEETGTTGGDHYAKIWIKTSGENSIYMYYGNETATTISNGQETFLFFENFTTDTTGEWSQKTDDFPVWNRVWRMRSDYDTANRRMRWKSEITEYRYQTWGISCFLGASDQDIYSPDDYVGFFLSADDGGLATSQYPGIKLRSESDGTGSDPGWETSQLNTDEEYIYELRLDPNDKLYGDIWDLSGYSVYSESISDNLPTDLSYHALNQYRISYFYSTASWTHDAGTERGILRTEKHDSEVMDLKTEIKNEIDWWFVAKYVSSEPEWGSFGNENSLDRTYGSPINLEENSVWQWANFTWQNPGIPDGSIIGWRIYVVDSEDNVNSTEIMSFRVVEFEHVYVDDDADSGWYDATHVRTIQEGIDNVTIPGSIIHVLNGTYTDEVYIDKTINLIGEDKNTTVIDVESHQGKSAIRVVANGVNISGFTIQNSRLHYSQPIPPLPGGIGVFSNYCEIKGNIIKNNDYGIVLDTAEDNVIINNNITENGCGITTFSAVCCPPPPAEDNHIYHNNFIDNTRQASDSFTNFWDNGYYGDEGYIGGGNYWDNYTGIDNFHGSNQNIPGSDGIGDTPYEIGEDNEDGFPLMNPWNGTKLVIENHPPNLSDPPDGPTSGYVGTEYLFTANSVSDPDGDDISCLFDWGDGNQSEWTDFESSGSDITARYIWNSEGVFDVKVKVKDIDEEESEWSTTAIIDILEIPLPILEIELPSLVFESAIFIVNVTVYGTPIENASVSFLEENYYTNNEGFVILTAPLVDSNSDYTITVSHEEYESSSAIITVLDTNEGDDNGWIYGWVSDTLGNNIENVEISILISETTKLIVFTESNGYIAQVLQGTYDISASKQGYETESENNVEVNTDEATEVNFVLEEIVEYEPDTHIDENNDIVEAAIGAGITAKKISGEIDFELSNEDYTITLYENEISIEIITFEEDQVSFKIEAEGISGTIIAIRLFNNKDFSDIEVEYDGEEIERVGFTDIFNKNNGTSACFTRVLTEGEEENIMYCLVYVPHFSEHEITIQAIERIVDAVGGITALIFYISICIIVAVIFFSPMISNVVKRRMQFRRKK